MSGKRLLVIVAGAFFVTTATTDAALAARVATQRETTAIRAAAMAYCRANQPSGCRWFGGVIVSSLDGRYAWAGSGGDSYDTSGIARRTSGRWRMVRVVGGGASYCSQWLTVVPPRVARDLLVRGLPSGSSGGDSEPCGPRLPPLPSRRCGSARVETPVYGVRTYRFRASGMGCRTARTMVKAPTWAGEIRSWPGWRVSGAGCEGRISLARAEDVDARAPRVDFTVTNGRC